MGNTLRMKKISLYVKTMRLVKESGKTAAQLSRETGLGQRWMYMLMQGAYSDPGVNKIEQLHDHLDVNK